MAIVIMLAWAIYISFLGALGLWPQLVLGVINPTVVRMVEQLKV